MNIKVQCCGMALLALLAIIYGARKKLMLTSSKVFLCCLYIALLCLGMDILSLFAIANRDGLPPILTEFICKTYLVSLVLVSLLCMIYVATSISFRFADYKKAITVGIPFGAIVCGLIYALPIEIHEIAGEDLAWTDGPSCYMTYLSVFVLIVINLVQIFRYKNQIPVRQRSTVLIWMIMWITAAGVQAVYKQLLIVGFACALGILTVYIQFESPELDLDRNTGLFNYAAFTRYANQLYSGHKNFYVIAAELTNTARDTDNSNVYANVKKMYETFSGVPDAFVFKIMEKEVILIFTKKESALAAWQSFKDRPENCGTNSSLRFSYYWVEDPRCVSSQSELLELIQYAGIRQEDAKSGSFYSIGEETVSHMLSEQRMTQQIVEALEEDRVTVYYQPIFSVEKKRFTSAEALVRIVDRDGKLIPPSEFVGIAESNGMIIELGKRVFEKVCLFLRQNKPEKFGIDYIEINLSVVQCRDDKLADDYIDVMNTVGVDPCRINLEITESASTNDKRVLISNMERLMDCGIHFSLDDFGMGVSNLNYIVDMPVKIVKFDREMIQAYFANGKAKYVMDAAMHMIRGMGLEIVAEGVETEEQYKKMEDIKINFIQGYYFSKPLPEREFLEFLHRETAEDAAEH